MHFGKSLLKKGGCKIPAGNADIITYITQCVKHTARAYKWNFSLDYNKRLQQQGLS